MIWDGVAEHWGKGQYRDVPTSKYVRACRERHVKDLKRWLSNDPSFPFYYDIEEADRAVWFFAQLRHFEGEFAGKPFELSDWQELDIIRPLFGWKRLSDGTRRYRKAYIEIARGNGKSMLAAGIGNLLFMADHEHGAQVYSAATKEDQAKIVWGAAKKCMEASPTLREEFQGFKSSLFCPELGSVFRPLGRDSKAHDGFRVHGGIVDEYHAHDTEEILEVLSSGTVKCKQPLIVIITTAGLNTSGPCKKESDFGKRILDGVVTKEDQFVFIATVDDPEKWENEEEWYKANPNLGISVYLDTFRSEFEDAKLRPSKRAFFKTKNLNIWTSEETVWIPVEKYSACDGEVDWSKFRGKRCFCGLDLGISHDISAFAMAFLGDEKPEPRVYLRMKFWIPEVGKMERYRNDGVNYPEWADEGWIETTAGETTRYDIIRRDIATLSEEYDIAEIAIDRAHAHQLMGELADDGFNIVKHAQTMLAMAFPCRSLEELIYSKRLQHNNDPVLRWMMGNAVIVTDGNENMKIMKDRSKERVDGVVASVMAIGRLLIAPQPINFVYNTRGLYVG